MGNLRNGDPAIDQPVAAGGKVFTSVGTGSTAPQICFGSGAPTLVATKGSIYLRTDGSSTSTRLYVASDAAGTWVAVTTAS